MGEWWLNNIEAETILYLSVTVHSATHTGIRPFLSSEYFITLPEILPVIEELHLFKMPATFSVHLR
jgi:hypothetical protein